MHHQSQMNRLGFSLIELLIVLAVIGVLVGLLVPAAQRARESANSALCANHLRQIGVAAHSYLDLTGVFPPQSYTQLNSQFVPGSGITNWYAHKKAMAAYLLPYVEESAQAQSVAEEVETDQLQGVATFLCPSRRGVQAGPRTDYAGPWMLWTGFEPWWWNGVFGGPTSTGITHWLPVLSSWGNGANPIHISQLEVSINEVNGADGCANTLLLAHKGIPPEFYHRPIELDMEQFPFGLNWGAGLEHAVGSAPGHDAPWWNKGPSALLGYSTYSHDGEARYPYGFFRDSNEGQWLWLSKFNDPDWLDLNPTYELMTSPHASMPCLWVDGSVRRVAFTKDSTLRRKSGAVWAVSPEVEWLTYAWIYNDGRQRADLELTLE